MTRPARLNLLPADGGCADVYPRPWSHEMLATTTRHEERDQVVLGVRIHYRVAGDGPPLVLLHGAGDSGFDWSWVLPDLAQDHRVYALDLPGFGASDKPLADYSAAWLARFVSAFLHDLGIGPAVLVGNSGGGLAALRVALAEPEQVAALVLVDSAGLGHEYNRALLPMLMPGVGDVGITFARTPWGAAQRAWLRAALLFAERARVPPDWLGEQYRLAQLPGFLRATLAGLRAQLGAARQRDVLLDQLPRLTIPTLVLWGEADPVFPVAQAEAAAGRLRNGRLAVIPGCGHLPHVERPDRFLAALQPFLAGPGAARRGRRTV